jgi:hypothetical protein
MSRRLMPFVDDDKGERRECLSRALLREHDRETFRRRDQEARRFPRGRRPLALRRVAGAGAHAPRRRSRGVLGRDASEGFAQRSLRVGGQIRGARRRRRGRWTDRRGRPWPEPCVVDVFGSYAAFQTELQPKRGSR